MKLSTLIKPRLDGTVIVQGLDGAEYTFQMDETGDMTCDVPHEETIAKLLETGNFIPSDADGYAAALAAGVHDDEPDDEPVADLNAAPVEANTPARAGRGRSKAAA